MRPSLVPLVAASLLATAARVRADEEALRAIPHVAAEAAFSGEACAEMFLRKLGKPATGDDVFELSGVAPSEGRGCRIDELAAALAKLGFAAGAPVRALDPANPGALEAEWKALVADLGKGAPSIVRLEKSLCLVVGFEAGKGELVLHDPSRREGASVRVARERFLEQWRQGEGARAHVERLALALERFVAPPPRTGVAAAAFARRVAQVREKARGFEVVVERPFVVAGDEPRARVLSRAEHTVRWAVAKLRQDFFDKDPEEIVDVWLFKDKESYERNALALFGDHPTTPYGYYSPRHHALIMNVATGGGTLVHEIVHPFVRANFPECPPWLNEGLGSLFEQCEERDGHIRGLTNWRLAGIQSAIRAGTVPTFEKLTGLSNHAFYEEDRGTNYAQARYLCHHLQEKGLLTKLWREVLAHRKEDPTGYASLKKVLEVEDMKEFQVRWQESVLKLTFP